MTKFNKAGVSKTQKKIINRAGGKAYTISDKVALFAAVNTTFLSDKFYESASERMKRIEELSLKCPAEFVAQVAIWARKNGNLRSAPIWLTALLAGQHNGDNLVRRTVKKVVNRADEITEMLGAYKQLNGEDASFSHQMLKGLGDAFLKFDEYQLSKYNRPGDWRLKDALFICRPKTKDKKQKALLKKLAEDKLETAETWETSMSELGQVASSEELEGLKGERWGELLADGKLPHMALLRNLRNILDTVTDVKVIKAAAKELSDEGAVLKGKQLPFRYLSAYNSIEDHKNAHTVILMDAIEDAMEIAADNVPGFDKNDTVAIFNDVSGSMMQAISPKSTIMARDVGIILGAMLRSKCKYVLTGVFGDEAKIMNTSNRGGIIENCKKIISYKNDVGNGTNGASAIDLLIDDSIDVDKVVVVTDMQMWYGDFEMAWNTYHEMFPKAKLYLIDVAGYGDTPIKAIRSDVTYVAGWSDKIFGLLEMLDNGEKLVDEICKIEV